MVVLLGCLPTWFGWGLGVREAGIRILDPGRANCQAHLWQTSVSKHAPLPQEDVFWGGFIGLAPHGGERLNRQPLLMSAMLLMGQPREEQLWWFGWRRLWHLPGGVLRGCLCGAHSELLEPMETRSGGVAFNLEVLVLNDLMWLFTQIQHQIFKVPFWLVVYGYCFGYHARKTCVLRSNPEVTHLAFVPFSAASGVLFVTWPLSLVLPTFHFSERNFKEVPGYYYLKWSWHLS